MKDIETNILNIDQDDILFIKKMIDKKNFNKKYDNLTTMRVFQVIGDSHSDISKELSECWVYEVIKNETIKNEINFTDNNISFEVNIKLHKDKLECYHNGKEYTTLQLDNVLSQITNCIYEYENETNFFAQEFESDNDFKVAKKEIYNFIKYAKYILAILSNVSKIELEDLESSSKIVVLRKSKYEFTKNIYITTVCEIHNTEQTEEKILLVNEDNKCLVMTV